MRRSRWASLSVAVAAATVVTHLSTYVPTFAPSKVWLLPLGAAIATVWVAVIVRSNKRSRGIGLPTSEEEAERWLADYYAMPAWAWAIGAPVMMYLLFNFFVSMGPLREGGPVAEGGHYYLDYKGRRVREITTEEYRRLTAVEVRLISGHLVALAGAAAVFFVWVEPRRHLR